MLVTTLVKASLNLQVTCESKYCCMDLMLENALLRRLFTVTSVLASLVLVTLLLPLVLPMALIVDVLRNVSRDRPFMALRLVSFGWLYLLGEAWGLLVLGLTALLPRAVAEHATFGLQNRWAAWNFRAVRYIFDLEFIADGLDQVLPGPIILLSRHASLIDTLLPAWFISRNTDLKLRYVLKKELLWDPALDIAGNRLPNHFVDRGASDSERDLNAIKDLAEGLQSNEAVLIYPEGTRFSEDKLRRYVDRFRNRKGRVAEIAVGLRRVLPPRPGGTLALLEGSAADVVVLAHRGLEGFARVKDMWRGGLVGSRIHVAFRRISRSGIPEERSERVKWLFETWSELDNWVAGEEPVPGLA